LTNSKNKIKKSMDKLIQWVEKKNWTVGFYSTYSAMRWWDREIEICSRLSPETQLHDLLHECGHLILHLNHKKYRERFPYSDMAEDLKNLKHRKSRRKSKRYKIDEISEELEAWEQGKKLAKRLNILLDKEKYHRHMTEGVWSYIEAATEE
jgi:hypothetical protein